MWVYYHFIRKLSVVKIYHQFAAHVVVECGVIYSLGHVR